MNRKGYTITDAPLLAERTTMALGGAALAEVTVAEDAAVDALPDIVRELGGTPYVLGAGSNIIASDAQLPIVLIKCARATALTVEAETADTVTIRAAAGLRLPALLRELAKCGFGGLEGLCGIPGTVGGAVFMNAGSYGTEMGSVLDTIEVVTPADGRQQLPASRFTFSYRSCTPDFSAEWFLITAVTCTLKKELPRDVYQRMVACYTQKQRTQPVTAKSAGCVFKNPGNGLSAGKLLDEAGLRGLSKGGMAFSEKHANFLVNEGDGSFSAAMDMIAHAQERVRAFAGVDLALEVRIWQ